MTISASIPYKVAVIISADIEWQVVLECFPQTSLKTSPLGEWFETMMDVKGQPEPVLFFHGGWGKIATAASTQYIIDRWSPGLLVNLGTCGGFEGEINRGAIILVERTVVYDIIEQIGDYHDHIVRYSTDIDLAWLGEEYPHPVRRTLLMSADRDLLPEDISRLKGQYGAVAGDWESGAIAWVAERNHIRCLILRGVSDLVGSGGGEAYEGNINVFVEGARQIIIRLVEALPGWLDKAA